MIRAIRNMLAYYLTVFGDAIGEALCWLADHIQPQPEFKTISEWKESSGCDPNLAPGDYKFLVTEDEFWDIYWIEDFHQKTEKLYHLIRQRKFPDTGA